MSQSITRRGGKPAAVRQMWDGLLGRPGEAKLRRSRRFGRSCAEALESRVLLSAAPVLDWSSYLGGSSSDNADAIAIDAAGNAWVTGGTFSPGWAVGGFDTSYNGGFDAFIAKINADGTLAWSSYLGGSAYDWGHEIALDAAGNAWVTGRTYSPGWAVGGFDTTHNGGTDAFIAKISTPQPAVTASSFHLETAPHHLRFSFDRDASAGLGSEDLLVQNLTSGQTIPSTDFALAYNSANHTAFFIYTGSTAGIAGMLADGNYRATILAAGTSLPVDHVFHFRFLQGDANNDGTVNLADFDILAANFGQSPRTFSQGDFNYDGIVNLADFSILAGRFGVTLPAGRPGASPFAGEDRDAADGHEFLR
jgi:hypothetical protein